MLGTTLAGSLAAANRSPWLLTVQTTGASEVYAVDIYAGTSPVINVDWGDGTAEIFTTTGVKTHTYTDAGTYILKLSGRFAANGNIRFGSDATNKTRLKAVSASPYIPGLASFNTTFHGASGLTSIPADLFRYNPQVAAYGFMNALLGTGITSIPVDLFRYNTLVSAYAFTGTFRNCGAITSIPTDLFRYNTLVSTAGFESTFLNCSLLESAPDLLFAYSPSCVSFSSTLQNCNKLRLPANLFSEPADIGTRFLNKTVTFANMMNIGTFTGVQGVAPALWSYNFGTGTPTKTSCFTGHSSSTVSNYADIPADWK